MAHVWIGWKHPAPGVRHIKPRRRPYLRHWRSSTDVVDRGRALAAVYLGESEGQPFYIYAQHPPAIIERIFEISAGNRSGENLAPGMGAARVAISTSTKDRQVFPRSRAGDSEPIVALPRCLERPINDSAGVSIKRSS